MHGNAGRAIGVVAGVLPPPPPTAATCDVVAALLPACGIWVNVAVSVPPAPARRRHPVVHHRFSFAGDPLHVLNCRCRCDRRLADEHAARLRAEAEAEANARRLVVAQEQWAEWLQQARRRRAPPGGCCKAACAATSPARRVPLTCLPHVPRALPAHPACRKIPTRRCYLHVLKRCSSCWRKWLRPGATAAAARRRREARPPRRQSWRRQRRPN